MTVLKGFVITIASGLGFGCLGAMLGFALGKAAPDYYRIVFHVPPNMPLDPAQAGLGLGLTQGLGAGLFIGLVIVVTVAWYNSRISSRQTEIL